jgi:hypothetical protein
MTTCENCEKNPQAHVYVIKTTDPPAEIEINSCDLHAEMVTDIMNDFDRSVKYVSDSFKKQIDKMGNDIENLKDSVNELHGNDVRLSNGRKLIGELLKQYTGYRYFCKEHDDNTGIKIYDNILANLELLRRTLN